jgi:hypothetical protein
MILVALVPPAWRRVMDPRLLAHYEGRIELANRRPGGPVYSRPLDAATSPRA